MATVESAILAYINHDPTYHTNQTATYVLPNDAPEHARLETQARHLSAIMNNQIIHAPIPTASPNLNILDVGCGTGIVTDYLGSRFSSAQVYGLDLSPVPALQNHRPSNVKFLQGNILSDDPKSWGFGKDQDIFDLIFSRLLVCGMNQWSKYIAASFALLQPGGYMEIHDLDWIWYDKDDNEISDKWAWWQTLKAAGEKTGLDWECGSKTASWMKDAGFTHIKVERYYWPFGGQWEKDPAYCEFGEYVKENMVSMVWHMIPRLLKEGGMDCNEDVIRKMREEMKRDFEPEEGKRWIFYVTVGAKPDL